jgi:alpha-ketoglutarate-dependent taurine dioxygenase
MQNYDNLSSRFFTKHERRPDLSEEVAPLVIEPRTSGRREKLREAISRESGKLTKDLAKYGAVLFRGFGVATPLDFEKTVLSIDGITGIANVFMSEEGRDRIPGTQFVLHTNSKAKTGGGVFTIGFHNENYYVPDVPRYIALCCFVPSLIGGETALVNMAHVYNDLPGPLRDRLEARTFWVSEWTRREVLARYEISEALLVRECREVGLSIEERGEDMVLKMYKPSIIVHPVTGEKCLVVNLSSEMDPQDPQGERFMAVIKESLWPNYAGWRWAIHRFLWRHPNVAFPQQYARSLLHRAMQYVRSRVSRPGHELPRAPPLALPELDAQRVFADLTGEEAEVLATSTCRRMSMFSWQAGDVMIVDNIKMAHSGMPGFGRRTLRAMICNPVPLMCSETAPGCQVAKENRTTLGDRMVLGSGPR